jgi:hypothetical protein
MLYLNLRIDSKRRDGVSVIARKFIRNILRVLLLLLLSLLWRVWGGERGAQGDGRET